ncbi:hypothetical protein RCL1_001332 [Eukaryota sp. TZLM3-RCL]
MTVLNTQIQSAPSLPHVTSLAFCSTFTPFWDGGPICLSSDHKYFFTNKENRIRIVDTENIPRSILLPSEQSPIVALNVSSKNILAVAHASNIIRLFQQSSSTSNFPAFSNLSQLRLAIKKSHVVSSLAFDPSSTFLACGTSGGQVLVYDLRSSPPSLTHTVQISSTPVSCLEWASLGVLSLFIGFDTGLLACYSLLTKQHVICEQFQSIIMSLSFNLIDETNCLIVTSGDSTVGLIALSVENHDSGALHISHENFSPNSIIALPQRPTGHNCLTFDDYHVILVSGDQGFLNSISIDQNDCSMTLLPNRFYSSQHRQFLSQSSESSFPNLSIVKLIPAINDTFWTIDEEMSFTLNQFQLKKKKKSIKFDLEQVAGYVGNGEDIISLVPIPLVPADADLSLRHVASSKFALLAACQTSNLVYFIPSEVSKSPTTDQKVTSTGSFDLSKFAAGHHGSILSIDYLPLSLNDNQSINQDLGSLIGVVISSGKDGKIILWGVKFDFEKGNQSFLIVPIVPFGNHQGAVSLVKISPESNQSNLIVYSIGVDGIVKKWSVSKFLDPANISVKNLWNFFGSAKDINSLDVSVNGKMIAFCGQDKSISLIDTQAGSLIKKVEKAHKKGVWSCHFSTFERALVTGGSDGLMRLWKIPEMEIIKTFQGFTGSVIQSKFLSPNQIMGAGSDGTIRIFSIKSATVESVFATGNSTIWSLSFLGFPLKIQQSKMIEGQNRFLFVGNAQGSITIVTDNSEVKTAENLMENEEKINKMTRLDGLFKTGKFFEAAKFSMNLALPRHLSSALQSLNDKDLLDFVSELQAPDCLNSSVIEDGNVLVPLDVLIEQSFVSSIATEKDEIDINKNVAESKSEFENLLNYISAWSTRTATSSLAVRLLEAVFSIYSFNQILRVPNIRSLLVSLLPTIQRHYDRFLRLKKQSKLVQIILERNSLYDFNSDSVLFSNSSANDFDDVAELQSIFQKLGSRS